MSPARPPNRTRGPASRRRGGWGWIAVVIAIIVVAAVVAAGWWWFYPRWRPAVPGAAAPGQPHPVSTPAAAPSAMSTPAAACWSPAPLGRSALQLSHQAQFATVEQLLGGELPAVGHVYRVQAHLTGITLEPDQAYQLSLTSMVDPQRQITARLPAGRCVSNHEDAALYDELREDVDLRFGSPAQHPVHLAQPAAILVTAPEAATPQGVVLEPVLDLSVQ